MSPSNNVIPSYTVNVICSYLNVGESLTKLLKMVNV